MARTPPSGEDRSRDRGIGSLPPANQLATFVPVTNEESRLFYDLARQEGYDEAYKRTGIFSAPFANFRMVREISDAPASINSEVVRSGREDLLLSDVLNHPELFEAYPALEDVLVKVDDNLLQRTARGSFNPQEGVLTLRPDMSDEELLSVILHEAAGHGVQTLTGMVPGGNTYLAAEVSDAILEDYPGYDERTRWRQESKVFDVERKEDDIAYNLAMERFWQSEYEATGNETWLEAAAESRARAAEEQGELDQMLSGFLSPDAPPFYERLPIDPRLYHEIYRAFGGETAARLIQNRANMTEEELRQSHPTEMMDVPWQEVMFITPYLEELGYFDPLEQFRRDPAAGFGGDNE